MAAAKAHRARKAIQVNLEEVILHLRQIQSTVIVAVAALRHQCAERDDDIADVLQRSVVDKLEDQIERTEAVLRALRSRPLKPH
jgi:hypothetical protein